MPTRIGTRYAIRLKGTMKFLPDDRYGRPSHVEPDALKEPRLFDTPRAAQIALTTWAKGRASYVETRDRLTGYERSGVDYDAVPGRDPEKMEIVPVDLMVRW